MTDCEEEKQEWKNPLAKEIYDELAKLISATEEIPFDASSPAAQTIDELNKRLRHIGTELHNKQADWFARGKPLLTREVDEWIDVMTERLDKYEIARNEYLADYDRSPQTFRLYRDVILPFCENTLIMDSIARTEGASYKPGSTETNRLKIRTYVKRRGQARTELNATYPELSDYDPRKKPSTVATTDANRITHPHRFPYLFTGSIDGPKKLSLEDALNTKKIRDDVEVLLNSEQAIFSILENYIRNAAKHNKRLVQRLGLEITIQLDEKEDSYHLTIFDNVSRQNKSGLNGLCERIKSSVSFGDGKAPMANLGFADVCINSFLMRWSANEIDQGSQEKPLYGNCRLVLVDRDKAGECHFSEPTQELAVRTDGLSKKRLDTKKFRFGLQFDVLKPKTVLWIGEDIGINNRHVSDWKNDGIVQYPSLDAYLGTGGDEAKEIAAFEFVVFFKDFDTGEYQKHQHRLPARVLLLDLTADHLVDIEKPNIVNGTLPIDSIVNAQALRLSCWKMWLKIRKEFHSSDKLPIDVYVYFENSGYRGYKTLENGTRILNEEILVKSITNTTEDGSVAIRKDASLVLYDHHGWGKDKMQGQGGRDFYTVDSKIVFDKGSDDFNSLSNLPDDPQKLDLLLMRLVEAATTNVFVLDERIAVRAMSDSGNQNDKRIGKNASVFPNPNTAAVFQSFSYGKVFLINQIKLAGEAKKPIVEIGIPGIESSLCISPEEKDISVSLEFRGGTQSDFDKQLMGDFARLRKDILVIHRTYLNKAYTGFDTPKNFIDAAQMTFGSVVVTSGGGYPHNIGSETEVRFLPFSVLDKCLASRLSKLKLVSSLQSCTY
jgi:hypothetical protein